MMAFGTTAANMRTTFLPVLLSGIAAGQESVARPAAGIEAISHELPLYFIENHGVYPEDVAYYVSGQDKTLFFTRRGVTLRLAGKQPWTLKLDFMSRNERARPVGENRQRAVFSYFAGRRENWKTGLPTFSRVVYRDLWPGIDLIYAGSVHRLKYEFSVRPGADPAAIRIRYRGATRLWLESGTLRIATPAQAFGDAAPLAYQDLDGRRIAVQAAYELGPREADGSRILGFTIGRFDATRPLVLDPAMIVYCGYLGGGGADYGYDIAALPSGETFVTGHTTSSAATGFPRKVGPDLTYNGQTDAFVAKINAKGTALDYCGYIGGTGTDQGWGIAVDRGGHAHVVGLTNSNEFSFPVRGGPDLTLNGRIDAFIAKVNPQGTSLVYCGYIGGAQNESADGVGLDASGNAYVTGYTASSESSFPVVRGPDLTFNGGTLYGDAFVAKVNPQGTRLVYCGYIGGSGNDRANGIGVDPRGNVYVTGFTASNQASFPVKTGPDLTFNGGTYDAFVAKVNDKGNGLDYCGYLGGASTDIGQGIAVDAAGQAYAVGHTFSTQATFPARVGPDLTHNGGADGYVAKLNPAGTALVYCGYLGGSRYDFAFGVAVDTSGHAYLTGITQSTDFPVKAGPDTTYNGGIYDAFVAQPRPDGTALLFSGYLGGSLYDWSRRIALDGSRNAYVAGHTQSTQATFPVKRGPVLTHGGSFDAFVAKVSSTRIEADRDTAKPGTTVNFTLTATADPGFPYVVGSSLGRGPIRIDTRALGLSPDGVLLASMTGTFPQVFVRYLGRISAQGGGNAAFVLPNDPIVIGLAFHTAFVTLHPSAPSGIQSISNTVSFTAVAK